MSGRTVLSAFIGAIVLFVWGFVFWTVMPWSMAAIRPVPNHAAVVAAIQGLSPGTYFYPDVTHTGMPADDPGAEAAWNDLYRRGPVVELRVSTGTEMMSAWTFIWGFVHFLASTMIASLLLVTVARGLAGYGARVLFLTLLGLLIGVFADLSGPIWFHYPWDRALADFGYTLVGWFLAGLVMAKVIGGRTEAA